MTQATNFATLNDIKAALTAVQLPMPGVPALVAISKAWRDTFCQHLADCVTGKDADGSKKKILEGLLSSLSPEVMTSLEKLGHRVELDVLVPIGLKFPTKFTSALTVALDAQHERNAEAKDFIAGLLVPPPPSAAPPPAEPQVPTGSDEPVLQPEPEMAQSAARGGDQYRSAHAYGSGFALCFNATIGTDGKPGIMVDAAVSSGPRTYDWKNAIHIMLDAREVACVLAVFRRWRKSVEFSAHGAQNDKSFLIEFQNTHFFCKVMAKKAGANSARAVKILPVDAHKIAVLFLEQLLLAYPNLPAAEVIALARSVNEPASRETSAA